MKLAKTYHARIRQGSAIQFQEVENDDDPPEIAAQCHRGDPVYEQQRTEFRQMVDEMEPLPADFADWPEYFLANRVGTEMTLKGLVAGVFEMWRFDGAGRMWLRKTHNTPN